MLKPVRAEELDALLDDSVNWNIAPADWQPARTDVPVQTVTRESYDAFRALWTDERMYWNADRIGAAQSPAWTRVRCWRFSASSIGMAMTRLSTVRC